MKFNPFSILQKSKQMVKNAIEAGRSVIQVVKDFTLGKSTVSTEIPKPEVPAVAAEFTIEKVSVSSEGRAFGRLVNKELSDIFNEAFENLLISVKNHPVSKELNKKGTHSSKFLTDGDLFSFIGFPVSSDPVADLIDFLQENIYIKKREERSNPNSNVIYEVIYVHIPEFDDFKKDPKMSMPWEEGNVWPFAIESYIAGYQYYLPLYLDKSRSLAGIQNENPVRDNSFTPIPYISELLLKFRKTLEKSGAKIVK
jgi:hypothetical protein